jgi:peptide/nickel transport system permease protein
VQPEAQDGAVSDTLANLELGAERADLDRGQGRWAALRLAPGVLVIALALIGPWLTPHDPQAIVGAPYETPHAGAWLGTDYLGRDVWSLVLAGGRSLIVLSLLATLVTTTLGAVVGIVSAFAGGWVDALLSRLAGLFLMLPPIVIMLVLLNGWGYHAPVLVLAVVVTGAPFVSRIARAAALQVLHTGYVEQALALGDSTAAVLLREITPNVAGPILADAGLRIVAAMYLIAAVAFLGFGDEAPNWAAMLSQNIEGISLSACGVIVPAVLMAVMAVSANLLLDRVAQRSMA